MITKFNERWKIAIDSSLTTFAHFATLMQDVDLVNGILGTAILWPIRESIQNFDESAIQAVKSITGDNSLHILNIVKIFPDNPQDSIRLLNQQAINDPELSHALHTLINYFQVYQTFAAYLAQEFAPYQQQGDVYNLTAAIEGELINVGGIISIQQLAININVPYPTEKPRNKEFWILGISAIFLLFLLMGGYAWYKWIYTPPMGEGFNVAVAQFTTPNSLTLTNETSKKLSEELYNTLVEGLNRLPPSLSVDHRGPNEIGPVLGADIDTRRRAAVEIVADQNATILVYGIVTGEDPEYEVELEFYVNDAGFGYGSEIAGSTRLGTPVTVTLPLDAVSVATVNAQLDGRRRALQHIVVGLGNLYYDQYDAAWAEFDLAANIREWTPQTGQEVVELLMGAARLRAYNDTHDLEKLSDAQRHFETAQGINRTYARSYIGLGIIAYIRAQIIDPATCRIVAVDPTQLIISEGYYLTSLSDPQQTNTSYISTKANLGLGAVNLLGYEFGLDNWSAEDAELALSQVITDYNAAGQPMDLRWLASDAHAQLALLAKEQENWNQMIYESQQAIVLLQDLPNPPQGWQARYWFWQGIAYEKLGDLSSARDAYSQAIRLRTADVKDCEFEEWQNRFESLQEE